MIVARFEIINFLQAADRIILSEFIPNSNSSYKDIDIDVEKALEFIEEIPEREWKYWKLYQSMLIYKCFTFENNLRVKSFLYIYL